MQETVIILPSNVGNLTLVDVYLSNEYGIFY